MQPPVGALSGWVCSRFFMFGTAVDSLHWNFAFIVRAFVLFFNKCLVCPH